MSITGVNDLEGAEERHRDPSSPDALSYAIVDDHLLCRLVKGSGNHDVEVTLALQIGLADIGFFRRRFEPYAGSATSDDADFRLPATALAAFVLLSESAGVHSVLLSVSGETSASVHISSEALRQAGIRLPPLLGAARNEGLQLQDLWLASESELRLRFDGALCGSGIANLTAYQVVAGSMPTVREVGRCDLVSGGITICTVGLADPLWPVLLVMSAPDGAIRALDLIPFPSLLRGGVHHWELRAAAVATNDVRDCEAFSAALMRSFSQSRHHDAGRIDTIRIDAREAIGNERIFTGSFLRWLTGLMQITVRLERRPSDDELADHIASLLPAEDEGTRTEENGSLLLPADAVPTLFALVMVTGYGHAGTARSVGDERSDTVARPCAFIVQPRFSQRSVWSVCMPLRPDIMDDVQPHGCATRVPILSTGRTMPPGSSVAWTRPMAIRQPDLPTAFDPARLFPWGEAGQLPPADLGQASGASISVCLALEGAGGDCAALIDSLRFQSARPAEIVVAGTAPSLDDLPRTMVHALRSSFPDAVRYVVRDRSASQGAALVDAAERASGDMLVFVSPGMVLHDRRTLSVLRSLAMIEGVASAGVALLRSMGDRLGFCAAGYFLTGLSFSTAPALAYEALQVDEALAMTTYPVAANSSLLMASPRRTFQEVGGFSSDFHQASNCDVEFGLRAIQAGYLNLCTTVLTSIATEVTTPGTLDIDLLQRFPSLDLDRLMGATTVLRRLK